MPVFAHCTNPQVIGPLCHTAISGPNVEIGHKFKVLEIMCKLNIQPHPNALKTLHQSVDDENLRDKIRMVAYQLGSTRHIWQWFLNESAENLAKKGDVAAFHELWKVVLANKITAPPFVYGAMFKAHLQ